MTYILYLFICFFLVLFQSTLFTGFPLAGPFYDILIPFILYLGIYRPAGEGVIVILFLGCVMDSITGGPFGLYLTTYFGLFASVKQAIKYLHIGSFMLLPLVNALSVLAENLVFGVTAVIISQNYILSAGAVLKPISQIITALFTGPVIIMLIHYLHNKWDKIFEEIIAES